MKTQIFYLNVIFLFLLAGCSVKDKTQIVKFEGTFSEQKWSIKQLNGDLPADWSTSGFLTFEMNSTTTQRFDLKLYDAQGIRRLEILPFQGAWIRASVPLTHFQKMNTSGMDMAAIWKTSRPGYWIGFTGSVGSINNIDSLGVAMVRPIGSPTLQIRNVRLTMAAEDTILGPTPLVDELGQWIPAEWPGKAKSLDELKTAWSDEEKALKSDSLGMSKYGGFLGTKVKATGFFRVEKIDEKWWFVDPEGYLFFSNGSCCINPRSDISRVQGREYVFTALAPPEINSSNRPAGSASVRPQANRPAQPATASDQPARTRNQAGRRAQVSSFYTWNLFRRFGPEWNQKWIDLTVSRMNSWGINTVGNWSDASIGNSQRKAYVATLSGWGIDARYMGMPDVYAPDYAATVDDAAKRQCAIKKDDPYLLGYFIGNEPPWPEREAELAEVILSGGDSPMQTALKLYLVAGDTPERRKAFVYETFSKFIDIVNSSIKKYDPNHLNLGLRFGGSPPDDIIKASKDFDVFSLNVYGYSVNQNTLQKIYEYTGLPIIIGEFHFGTPGRGLAPGLAQTSNQEERGVAYKYYVENAAAHPALIGTHWFQWIDQPSTGRGDGENYNIGLLDETDRPYPEMIAATRKTFIRLYDVHSGKIPPVTQKALVQ